MRNTTERGRRAPWTLSGQDHSVWSTGHGQSLLSFAKDIGKGYPPGLDQTEGRGRQEKGEHEDDPVRSDVQSRQRRSACDLKYGDQSPERWSATG
ncbi:unnamed protein product [Prunus armeniaca]|uniref:Uncharacterized protein n=1 Tax=Prunus armeniaca TaxID=36596 RepID=A0A6J5W001_PRUAR|nr:unnamed protein product [Prunus armeniaca]